MGVPRGAGLKYEDTLATSTEYIDKHSTDTTMINSILVEVIASQPEDPLTAVHTALGKALEGRAAGIPQQIFVPYGGKVVVEYVCWVANKKLEISNFNFKFPRARNIEIIRYYRQTLQGSFSAVSKPNFASKY